MNVLAWTILAAGSCPLCSTTITGLFGTLMVGFPRSFVNATALMTGQPLQDFPPQTHVWCRWTGVILLAFAACVATLLN